MCGKLDFWHNSLPTLSVENATVKLRTLLAVLPFQIIENLSIRQT
jgi:hypothetical protein